MKHKEPTWTALVLEALREADGFMDSAMLRAKTGGNHNQISAACFSLLKYRAIDVVVNADGHGWWFARPPEDDHRLWTRVERTPESKPRKPRRKRVKSTL